MPFISQKPSKNLNEYSGSRNGKNINVKTACILYEAVR